MKIRVLLFSLLCPVVALPVVRAADEHAAPAAKHEEHTELGEHMEKISGAYRRLNRQIADATKNEDSLKLVATMHEHAAAAAKLIPAKAADIPAEQREKFVAGYAKTMEGFIADLGKLEAALKAGKNDEAAALVKTLKTDQNEGHKEYQKKQERKKS